MLIDFPLLISIVIGTFALEHIILSNFASGVDGHNLLTMTFKQWIVMSCLFCGALVLSTYIMVLVYQYVLIPRGLEYLAIIICTICGATITYSLSIIFDSSTASKQFRQGRFVSLVTLICAIPLICLQQNYSSIQSFWFSLSAGVAFSVLSLIVSGIRYKLLIDKEISLILSPWRFLFTLAIISLIFYGIFGL